MGINYKQEPGKEINGRYKIGEVKPVISVITPFFNSGKLFSHTYNCVVNQTFPWFEWIIVNDARTCAEDRELLSRYAETDHRIRVINSGELSISAARNLAVENSRADIIIPLDSDDLVEPAYFECLYFALIRNPDAAWSYTDNVTFQDNEYLWHQDFSSDKMKKENIAIYSGAIRKSEFSEVGGYSEIGKHFNEDWHFWLKLLAKGKKPVHIEIPLFWYRWSDTGALARFQKDEDLIRENRKVINSLAQSVPDGIRAITFGGKRAKEFARPEKWDWDLKLPFAEKKIRILMLLPHMECGGADKFNLDVLKNIDKSRFEIGIITTNPDANEWRQRFAEYADDIFELPAFLDMNDWAPFIHYYVYSRDVDIVWNISSYFGYYVLPWLRIEFPETAIIDCVHAEGKYWRAGGYPRVSAAMDDVIEKTFVTNEYTRDIMAAGYKKPLDKMQVIHTGVDETEFDPDKVNCEGLRESLGIDKDRPVVLFLCRIAAEKRPFMMLEIAEETRKKIPDICFLVVGNGPQADELKSAVRKKGLERTVYLIGGREDIKPFYKASDLFLLCSIKEGLSITTMEAMSMRLPVVSADVGSQYELVREDTGKLIKCRQDEAADFDSRSFPEEEVCEYANAIFEILSDKDGLKKIGVNCRNRILDGFTLSCLMNTLHTEFVWLCLNNTIQSRCSQLMQSGSFSGIYFELLNIYIEYESNSIEFNKTYKISTYLYELLTFKRSIFSLIRIIVQKKYRSYLKSILKRIFNIGRGH